LSPPTIKSRPALGRDSALALAGAGATPALAEAAGAALLSEDPVTEADRVATR
jgi:hypothetical protein